MSASVQFTPIPVTDERRGGRARDASSGHRPKVPIGATIPPRAGPSRLGRKGPDPASFRPVTRAFRCASQTTSGHRNPLPPALGMAADSNSFCLCYVFGLGLTQSINGRFLRAKVRFISLTSSLTSSAGELALVRPAFESASNILYT